MSEAASSTTTAVNGPSQPSPARLRAALGAALIVGSGILARVPLLAHTGFPVDQRQFLYWGHMAANRGMAHVYDEVVLDGRHRRWCNYPPVYPLVLRGLAAVYPMIAGHPFDLGMIHDASTRVATPETKIAWVLFKLPAVAADLAAALLLYRALRRRALPRTALAVGLCYALNPAAIFDSAVWGQVDAIHTLWMLLSLDAAVRRRPAVMSAWAALAVLTKPQSLLLGPLWLAVLVSGFPTRDVASIARRMWVSLAVAGGVALLVVAPFGVEGLPGIRDAYTRAVGFYPLLHLNGFSSWFLANPLDAAHLDQVAAYYRRDDRPMFPGVTPRQLGMLAVTAAAVSVFVRLCRRCDDASLRWTAAALPLAFFVLPTQIHERYLFPAVALIAWGLSPSAQSWAIWLAVSVVAFLNAAWVWPGPWPIAPAMGGSATGVAGAVVLLAVLIGLLVRGPVGRPAPSDSSDAVKAA